MIGPTIGAALRAAVTVLAPVSESASLDAQVLLGHLLGVDRAVLLAHPERLLTAEQTAQYDHMVRQQAQGMPVPYLTGLRAFYHHDFAITPDVLIPRPETEHLVEAALGWVHDRAPDGSGLTLVDVGTGSGVIALSLAAALPGAAVYATDISPAALAVARHNAARIGVTGVRFYEGDLLDALPPAIRPDLIAANLPYIASAELDTLSVARHEPHLALDGGPDGLGLIRRLLAQVPGVVGPHFGLLLEIGADQGRAAHALGEQTFPGASVRVIRDYAGHDRVVEVER